MARPPASGVSSAAVLLALLMAASAPTPVAPVTDPQQQQPGDGPYSCTQEWHAAYTDLLATAQATLPSMISDSVSFWLTHGVDAQYGGFHSKLDRRGTPSASETDKALSQQCRHLYFFSALCRQHPRRCTPEVHAAVRGTRDFIYNHMRDPADGRFYHNAARNGSRGASVPDSQAKNLFSNLYAMYAMSWHALSFNDSSSRDAALAAFLSWDALAHDTQHGGYLEKYSEGPLLSLVSKTEAPPKSLQVHHHVLEALQLTWRASGDARVLARLREAVRVVGLRMLLDDGYLHAFFTEDWQPLNGTISWQPTIAFGHGIQTVRMMDEILSEITIGLPEPPSAEPVANASALEQPLSAEEAAVIRARVMHMGERLVQQGYDTATGAFRGSIYQPGMAADLTRDTDWWPVAESVPSMLRMGLTLGNATYVRYAAATLRFIDTYLRDHEFGEWFRSYNGTNPTQIPAKVKEDSKGDQWKASLHNGRMMLSMQELLR